VFLKEHADVRGKIENLLRKKMNIPVPGAANGSAPALPAQVEKPAEKPAVHAAAAAATAAAGKPRPAAK
jgi:hypothetical protein